MGVSRVYKDEPKHLEAFSVCGTCPHNQRPIWTLGRESGIITVPANPFNLIVYHLAHELPSLSLIQDEVSLFYLDIID